MGAVGASLTTDLVDLISARVWLCVAQVQRALVQALAARPATTTGSDAAVWCWYCCWSCAGRARAAQRSAPLF